MEAFVLMGRSALDWLFFRDVGVVDLFTGDEIDLVGAGPSMLGLGCREADLLNGLLVLRFICVLGSRLISKLALSAAASWSLLCLMPDAKSSA